MRFKVLRISNTSRALLPVRTCHHGPYNIAAFLPCKLEGSVPNIVSILECNKDNVGNISCAQLLHTSLCGYGLEALEPIGNLLVPTFVACGALLHAHLVFEKLHSRSAHLCSSLISGYIESGHLDIAISLYYRMQSDADSTLLYLLKACTRLNLKSSAWELHNDIIQKGIEQDVYIGSTLVDTYAKFGSVIEARSTFDNMSERTVVSWNALIAAYVDCDSNDEALFCFQKMQEVVAVDAVTFTSMLKACHTIEAIDTGRELHRDIVKCGVDQDAFVGSSLLSMYLKCGLVAEAWNVFSKLPHRDAVLWTSLLSGCAENGAGQEAMEHFEEMREEGISPTPHLYACSLKACSSTGLIRKGRALHIEVVKSGCVGDVFIGSSLIDMYAKHGLLADAQKVFSDMPVRNHVSWNALIAGYVDNEGAEQALKLHDQMLQENVSPDSVTISCCLRSCASVGALKEGHDLHNEAVNKGLESDIVIGTSLVDMYASTCSLLDAQELFNKMTVQNVVSWNALMAGYAEHGPQQQTLACYEKMSAQGISASAITLSCVLEACGSIACFSKGHKVYSDAIEMGFEQDYFVGNVLVNLYAKSGLLAEARQIFQNLPMRSSESWTALIAGYVEHEWASDALSCFEEMKSEGVFVDAMVFVCVLKACRSMKSFKEVQEAHIEILKRGFEKDPFVGITLVDVYCKCSILGDGHGVFDSLAEQSVVAWNVLIGGYTEHGPAHTALTCYDEMQEHNICPSIVTYVLVLKACAKVGAIEKGREIHKMLRQRGFESDPFVVCTLTFMYAECGSLPEAWEAFHKLKGPGVVPWNAMLNGLGINHKGDMALCFFAKMQQQGVGPNMVTFTCLLAACSRTSRVQAGERYFQAMIQDHNISPTLEHLASMVDVLARSGCLYQADKLFESLPHLPSKEMWTVLLSACQTYSEVELGERCFQQLIHLDQESAVPYRLMASIYASAGRWQDVKKIEELRKHLGGSKTEPKQTNGDGWHATDLLVVCEAMPVSQHMISSTG